MIGKYILHYKILEKLGEGGMGIVYLAEDTRLKRKVAIKFLPNYISADEEERKRFEIEAQAAASLNHPNIATVHSIEESEDPNGNSQTFIVMEYIEGKELKDIVKTHNDASLHMNDIINYAIQIAGGLEAAHKKGIIHRDIKSSNIMITNDGHVKIMDFGLAKVGKGTQLTKIGTTIGTAAYMSPEQARGEEVDNRTDIWSFGIVLYEMLTGELPFKGDYDQAIIYSIMNNEPDSLQKYLPEVSSSIIKIIDKTLEKDPEDRYKSMQDVLNDLKSTKEKTGRLKIYSDQNITKISKNYRKPSKKRTSRKLFQNRLFQVSAAIFFIAVIFLLVLWFSGPSLPKLNPNRSLSVISLPVEKFEYSAISPDGKMLAIPGSDVNGKWDIYLMDIKSGESRKLNVVSSANTTTSQALFSPDGTTIGFDRMYPNKNLETVCNVSVLGGYVRVIADTGVGLTWNSATNRVYYLRGILRAPSHSGFREYWSVKPDGSDKKLEFIDSLSKGTINSFSFSTSPDGKKAAYTRPFEGNFNEIVLHDLKTGKETRLTHFRKRIDDITWLKNGYILYNLKNIINSNLWVIPEDGGSPKQLTNEAFDAEGACMADAANRMIFLRFTQSKTLWEVNTDGTENKQVIPDNDIWDASISPDGNKAALIIFNQYKKGQALVLRNLKTGERQTLVPYDTLYKVWPQWSPGESYISYLEFLKGPQASIPKIKIMNLSEGHQPEDYGYGYLVKWVNDSSAIIQKTIGPEMSDLQRLGGRGKDIPKKLSHKLELINVHTLKAKKYFRDSVRFALPVLNNSKIIYAEKSGKLYIVSQKELSNNPDAVGRPIFRENTEIGKKIGKISFLDDLIYYNIGNSIWKMDLKTFRQSKVFDIKEGTVFELCNWQYSDKYVSYERPKIKEDLIMMDNVFLK